ncbi:MAG: endonuclease [Phycisphaerae bacterium]|nr:endonuclease [Phycisphaerae bacterium]
MTMIRSRFALLVFVVAHFFVSVAFAGDGSERADTWRVMSFNIRYGTADDGPDRWEVRASRVVAMIERHAPDVVGLQEPQAFQVAELLAGMSRYAAAGAHRLDGRSGGEGCVTLYDRTRFMVAEGGVFWLSDTPFVPGSISWDNAWPRSCTWTRLIEIETGRGLYVYNVHLDNRGSDSRERGAAQIREHFERTAAREHAQDPVIVMGDFNTAPESEPIETLLGSASDLPLVDTYRALHDTEPAGTYTAFDVKSDGGKTRMDLLLASADLAVLRSGIDRSTIDGRYPSDHFPVWADLRASEPPPEAARPNQ